MAGEPGADARVEQDLACSGCGANLKFHPGVAALACQYCGAETAVPSLADALGEQDFRAFLALAETDGKTFEITTAKCFGCGAESTFEGNIASVCCPFCGASALATEAKTQRQIKPQSVLPFAVPVETARKAFRDWIGGLWFAPSKLAKMRNADLGMQGVFLPHWTYDSKTRTSYVGQRGDYYYTTERYTTTDSKGKVSHRTRQVRHTRWRAASGVVSNTFDDVLVLASTSLPKKHVEKLEPWGLENLVAYDARYLAGFRSENYSVGLEAGFAEAERQMEPTIRATIRRDIGGDEQRILQSRTEHSGITFKHILLPVWISAYRFEDRVFRFVVNARTGEVQGERPWSKLKIAAAVLAGMVVAGVVIWIVQSQK